MRPPRRACPCAVFGRESPPLLCDSEQVDAYSALRHDMYSLGLGPFPCYAALSSGMHGIFTAMQLCESINVMGFSLELGAVHHPVHFRPISEQPSGAHSWAFDTLLLRALHLTGYLQICSS